MDLFNFIVGAGWLTLCIITVIGFGTWFDTWTKVHYRVWEQYLPDSVELPHEEKP